MTKPNVGSLMQQAAEVAAKSLPDDKPNPTAENVRRAKMLSCPYVHLDVACNKCGWMPSGSSLTPVAKTCHDMLNPQPDTIQSLVAELAMEIPRLRRSDPRRLKIDMLLGRIETLGRGPMRDERLRALQAAQDPQETAKEYLGTFEPPSIKLVSVSKESLNNIEACMRNWWGRWTGVSSTNQRMASEFTNLCDLVHNLAKPFEPYEDRRIACPDCGGKFGASDIVEHCKMCEVITMSTPAAKLAILTNVEANRLNPEPAYPSKRNQAIVAELMADLDSAMGGKYIPALLQLVGLALNETACSWASDIETGTLQEDRVFGSILINDRLASADSHNIMPYFEGLTVQMKKSKRSGGKGAVFGGTRVDFTNGWTINVTYDAAKCQTIFHIVSPLNHAQYRVPDPGTIVEALTEPPKMA